MNPNINPELMEIIQNNGLDITTALMYSFALEYDMIDKIVDSDLINDDNEHLYRISLTTLSPESNRLTLKVPLFSDTVKLNQNFEDFYYLLVNEKGLSANGHPNNRLKYAAITRDAATAGAFEAAARRIKHFNMNKLADVVSKYYATTEMAMRLNNYLDKAVDADYYNYQPTVYKGKM